MMYSVGRPANLSKKITQQFVESFCPVRQHRIYYNYAFVFWTTHVTNPAPGFISLVPLHGGSKYDYIFKHTLIFFLKQI